MTMDRVNDFAFKIATANGTGSASANGLIMQAIFRMGVPVTGKNVFPSNIQGLPTWYEIRVNKDGYTARTPHFDLMVALNPATYDKDVAEVRAAVPQPEGMPELVGDREKLHARPARDARQGDRIVGSEREDSQSNQCIVARNRVVVGPELRECFPFS